MPGIVNAAQLTVAALEGLPVEDQANVWWVAYRCIHDRTTLYGRWSTRLQDSWAAITQEGEESSTMSEALRAIVYLVATLEDADTLDNLTARGFLADIAKAADAVALSKICLLIALSHGEAILH